MSRLQLPLRGEDRKAYGAIYSLRHVVTNECLCIHRTGSSVERATAVAAWIDASGEPWRIVAISSPESVYSDLQGSRNMRGQRHGDVRRDEIAFDPLATERRIMGTVKRGDLVWPLRETWSRT